MFFNERDGPWYPTLRFLHKCECCETIKQVWYPCYQKHLRYDSLFIYLLRSVNNASDASWHWSYSIFVRRSKCYVSRVYISRCTSNTVTLKVFYNEAHMVNPLFLCRGRSTSRNSCWTTSGMIYLKRSFFSFFNYKMSIMLQAIYAEGKENALAIGLTKMSTADM